jgi:hypothetical protein
MITLTDSTLAALRRIATAPATSDQYRARETTTPFPAREQDCAFVGPGCARPTRCIHCLPAPLGPAHSHKSGGLRVNKKQSDLFDRIRLFSIDVGNLSSFVQNDFDRLIADGYVSPDEIKKTLIPEAAKLFQLRLGELQDLRLEVMSLLIDYSNNH